MVVFCLVNGRKDVVSVTAIDERLASEIYKLNMFVRSSSLTLEITACILCRLRTKEILAHSANALEISATSVLLSASELFG